MKPLAALPRFTKAKATARPKARKKRPVPAA